MTGKKAETPIGRRLGGAIHEGKATVDAPLFAQEQKVEGVVTAKPAHLLNEFMARVTGRDISNHDRC